MIVSITRLRVRAWRFLPPFLWLSLRSASQARCAEGNLGTWLLRDSNRVYWTRTAWRDESALRAFMTKGAHGHAMRRLSHWCDEAALVRLEQEHADPPSWREAHRELLARGRRSRVARPSADQQRFTYPPPRQERGDSGERT